MKHKVFIAVDVLSQRLGLPVAWLKAEAEAGRIPYLKAGNRLLFHVETVERVLLERARRAGRGNGHE